MSYAWVVGYHYEVEQDTVDQDMYICLTEAAALRLKEEYETKLGIYYQCMKSFGRLDTKDQRWVRNGALESNQLKEIAERRGA